MADLSACVTRSLSASLCTRWLKKDGEIKVIGFVRFVSKILWVCPSETSRLFCRK